MVTDFWKNAKTQIKRFGKALDRLLDKLAKPLAFILAPIIIPISNLMDRVAYRFCRPASSDYTKDHFASFSQNYDLCAGKIAEFKAPRELADRLLAEFKKSASHESKTKILDVGIGTGLLSQHFREAIGNCEIHGVDISPEMLEKCHEKEIADSITELDVSENPLPYSNESFNLVASCGMYEFVIDPKPSLNEMARVLKPGGILAFTTQNTKACSLEELNRSNVHTIREVTKIIETLGLEVISAETKEAYRWPGSRPIDYNYFIARKASVAALSTAPG